jgi:hypothetical protein
MSGISRCIRIPGPPNQRRPHRRELRWSPEINAALSFYCESGYAAAVLANYDPPAATDVAVTIERLLLQK